MKKGYELQTPKTIVLIEDDNSFRSTLEKMIYELSDFICVGSYAGCKDFLEALPNLEADIYWLDLNLPDGSGIDLLQNIKQKQADTLCMICSMHDDNDTIFSALKSGADGYLLKNASFNNITESLRELVNGGSPMSAFIARKVITSFHPTKDEDKKQIEELTSREIEVLNLISKGYSYKETGKQLGIAEETVRKHSRNIYIKLHVKNKTESALKFSKY
jgi:DNA-binding NarL/FixJ family response regulator